MGNDMGRVANFLRKIGIKRRKEEVSAADAEKLRAAFKARYHSFQLLLSANNKALEIMADMEQALQGNRPFGMSFVRASCTALSVNIFQIIKNLDQLAPVQFKGLYQRFRDIQDRINETLSRKKDSEDGPLTIPLSEIDKDAADRVGSKMANIGEVRNRLQLRVPDGFVISAAAYRRFFEYGDLQAEIDRRLQASDVEEMEGLYSLSSDIQQMIIRSAVPEDLQHAIEDSYRELAKAAGDGVRVSMRSSALGEDAAGTSFAGQYRSELNVNPDDLIEAFKEIVASKYSLQAIAYRLTRGILDEDIAMCVGCMAMVNAISGGVVYSRNPVNIRDDSILINSVWGLPKSVVDGSAASDLFAVSRGVPMRIVERSIREKDRKFVCYPEEGVCRMELTGQESRAPSIGDDLVLRLAEMALHLEEYYGVPQDIEWAADRDGTLFILQCRPLKQTVSGAETGNFGAPDTKGEVLLEGGVTASPGVACGCVCLVRKNSDTLRFPRGGVLVAVQALPRWAALLSRTSAVITEQGGAAGHLANVAREFSVPALFGITGAMNRLEDGAMVTVDADGLRVYKDCVESLLDAKPPVKNLMEGSPVFEILKEVVQHIVPLHLLDPDSAEFRPRNCRTFHDITRFCHEKSVRAMFSFGKEHRFSERASKQLVCDVPMQWWLINLDDGFKEDVAGRFVQIENIVSIPMLALWSGIVAIPWEGPPPVDSKGFMSILMEASANPALDPSMPSPYTNRNYFMISKNYCSLSSRFGFHFCTIEALVGERAGRNYISFQFKGGAADYQRRLRRAQFVASILEEFDFRVEVKEDGVFARIEGHAQEIMEEKLKILGYLIIHTRQLDMVMSNDAACTHHREKLLKDIHSIVGCRLPE